MPQLETLEGVAEPAGPRRPVSGPGLLTATEPAPTLCAPADAHFTDEKWGPRQGN